MFLHVRRLLQLLGVSVVVASLAAETRFERSGGLGDGEQVTVVVGWPLAWAAHTASTDVGAAGGCNPVLPAAAVLAAATLPLARRRWARVAVTAAGAAVVVAAVELDTAADASFGDWKPAALVLNRFGYDQREWSGYLFAVGQLFDLREWLVDDYRSSAGEFWRQRTVVTGWAALCVGGAAAGWWKPWRPAAPTTPPAA